MRRILHHQRPVLWSGASCVPQTFLRIIVVVSAVELALLWGCSYETILQNQSDVNEVPRGYIERYHERMRYGLFIPPSYDSTKSYPLIVSLHGSTDTVSWDLSWYHDPIQSNDPCFVLTPKSLKASSGWGTSWDPSHSEDMRKALDVADSLIRTFNININRLYIYGVSMGGFGVFSVLAREPGKFAGAFSICGGGNPATASAVAETPVWIFHGSDDRVVPVRYSRDMYQALLRAGARHVRYTEYPGVGHAAWTPAWEEPTLEWWLLAQEKGVQHSSPDTVENFHAEIVQNRHVKLSWNPPSNEQNPDNQVWYYKIIRDAEAIAQIDNTHHTFEDSSAAHGSTHAYAVSVVNYFFEESPKISSILIAIP